MNERVQGLFKDMETGLSAMQSQRGETVFVYKDQREKIEPFRSATQLEGTIQLIDVNNFPLVRYEINIHTGDGDPAVVSTFFNLDDAGSHEALTGLSQQHQWSVIFSDEDGTPMFGKVVPLPEKHAQRIKDLVQQGDLQLQFADTSYEEAIDHFLEHHSGSPGESSGGDSD